jgi:hypothetical protein
VSSVALAVVASAISLVPTSGPLPLNFAYAGNPQQTEFVTDLVAISAITFAGAAAYLWKRPVRIVLISGMIGLVTGAVLYVATSTLLAQPVQAQPGVIEYFQLYPQSFLPAIWGFVAIVFSPLTWWARRDLDRRGRAQSL